ncbi:MAG: DUF5335 family protein [Acidobacteriota bacterium]
MPTNEIPKSEWKNFFHDFSRFHRGWILTVEIFSRDFGAQHETREIPFEGIIAELSQNGHSSLELIMGESAKNHLTHTITAPTHVRYESEGQSEVIQIESQDGVTTLLSFHRASLPDRVTIGMLKELL